MTDRYLVNVNVGGEREREMVNSKSAIKPSWLTRFCSTLHVCQPANNLMNKLFNSQLGSDCHISALISTKQATFAIMSRTSQSPPLEVTIPIN